MTLSQFTLDQLTSLVNGDNKHISTPYKSGSDLVDLFNSYGFREVYKRGFPSRKDFTKNKLIALNGSKTMENFINNFVYSRNFILDNSNLDNLVDFMNKILKYDGYELKKLDGEYIVTGDSLIPDETIELTPTFEDIQQTIITEIKNAKYLIWIAVAWFTDETIFNELLEKKEEGINIQIIVSNDNITKQSGLAYEKYFETYKVNKFGKFMDNIFHEKFCVIDLKTVIHGSYNWSKKAQFNKESINIIKSVEASEKYADRFKLLKKNYNTLN